MRTCDRCECSLSKLDGLRSIHLSKPNKVLDKGTRFEIGISSYTLCLDCFNTIEQFLAEKQGKLTPSSETVAGWGLNE